MYVSTPRLYLLRGYFLSISKNSFSKVYAFYYVRLDTAQYTAQKLVEKFWNYNSPFTFDSADTSSAEKSSSTLVRKFNYLSSN